VIGNHWGQWEKLFYIKKDKNKTTGPGIENVFLDNFKLY
jgi:hypothetical protein